ncbi:hypothetical protein [Rubinisphaera sp.]|uniref:hypothetical protein n=1 Tax=Rubinisphaera sp. TaxID=2024857 RepID=UPI000C0F28AE|nr:hypothetical protein [Rubinisphaera sp.]MBV09005.1 hypothetical protein [Rubinisphaera sp.]HCS53263.1 hypothetical protein [Planctomycetaceae bacterium]
MSATKESNSVEKLKKLKELGEEAETWSAWGAKRKRLVREAIGDLASDWEIITSTGIIRKGIPGIFAPGTLGIPFSAHDLQYCYPELVSITKWDD